MIMNNETKKLLQNGKRKIGRNIKRDDKTK